MKELAIEMMHVGNVGFLVRIVKQTHQGGGFGSAEIGTPDGRSYCSRTKMMLCSLDFPGVDFDRRVVFVRGRDTTKSQDWFLIPIRFNDFAYDLAVAVREYNEYFKDNPKDSVRLPPAGDTLVCM